MVTISSIVDDATVAPEIEATFNKIKTVLNAPFTSHFFSCVGSFAGVAQWYLACYESHISKRSGWQTPQGNDLCRHFVIKKLSLL